MLVLAAAGCSKKQAQTNGQSSMNPAVSLERFQENGVYGYRDMAGKVVIKPQFAEAGDFSLGLARVRPDAKGGWGYIDASGDMTIPAQYEGASDFVDGIAVVLSKGELLYIGPDGGSLGSFNEDQPPRPLRVGDTLYVIHPGGLIARALGDAHAAPMGAVKPREAVENIYDPHSKRTEMVDGLLGTWRLVRYQGKSGYLFDLYLSRYPLAAGREPIERYRVVASELKTADYSTYALTKFASGGRMEIHNGPYWTEFQEIVPEATVDQVVARMKFYPEGDVGSLVGFYRGTSGTFMTETGDTVVVSVRRDGGGFLENLALLRKGEGNSFDVSISKYNADAVEIATTFTSEQTETQSQPSSYF